MRWNLKEAAGKTLARRTGIAYEADAAGEEAYIFKARSRRPLKIKKFEFTNANVSKITVTYPIDFLPS
jgi:hypothetical protein